MLQITTDNNSIKAQRNGLVLFIAAKNTVSYSYDNARIFLNPPETVRISETFSGGITMNGTPITADNIESEFADLFEAQGGGAGTDDHTQLTNRDAADQHPISAITDLRDELDGRVKLSSPDVQVLDTDLRLVMNKTLKGSGYSGGSLSVFNMLKCYTTSGSLPNIDVDVVELGDYYAALKVYSAERPTVNDTESIAYLSDITAAAVGTQTWLPAVQTVAALPAVPNVNNTYLCKVIADPVAADIGVWQWIGGQATTAWTYYSDEADFVDEQELDDALKTTLTDNAGSTTLPATASGTLVSKIQALRDNVKLLFSYFVNDKAKGSLQADKLATARTISLSGDATGSAAFDGSADIEVPVTLNSLGLIKNGVVRIAGNGGDYAAAVGEYDARRYFRLADIAYQTQGWDSRLFFDIYYTQAAPAGHAGAGEVYDKVVLRLKFDPDDTFDIIQRPDGVDGNGIIILHDAARQVFEMYACASPGTDDSNRLYIDVRNAFFYIVNNEDNNLPVVNFFTSEGSYSNNTGLTQAEFNALPKTSAKWLWDNLFTELPPSQVPAGDRISGFEFLTDPDTRMEVPGGQSMTAFNIQNSQLRLRIYSQDFIDGNGVTGIGQISIVDYGGGDTVIWHYQTGWGADFSFEYADTDMQYTVSWDNRNKRIALNPPDVITAVDANNGLLDGLILVDLA